MEKENIYPMIQAVLAASLFGSSAPVGKLFFKRGRANPYGFFFISWKRCSVLWGRIEWSHNYSNYLSSLDDISLKMIIAMTEDIFLHIREPDRKKESYPSCRLQKGFLLFKRNADKIVHRKYQEVASAGLASMEYTITSDGIIHIRIGMKR